MTSFIFIYRVVVIYLKIGIAGICAMIYTTCNSLYTQLANRQQFMSKYISITA